MTSNGSEAFSNGPWWNTKTQTLSRQLVPLYHWKESCWNQWNGRSQCLQSGTAFVTRWSRPVVGTAIPKSFWTSHDKQWKATAQVELEQRAQSAKSKNKGQKKDYKVEVNELPESTMKCQKHLIAHSCNQLALFRRWFGVHRWTYNRCCDMWNQKQLISIPSLKEIRSLIVNIDSIKEKYPNDSSWILEVPYDIRDKAVTEFVKNIRTQIVSLGKSRDDFYMKYKTKRTAQSIEIDVKHWHQGTPFPTCWNKNKLERLEFWKKRRGAKYSLATPQHAVRLLSDTKPNTFFIATPRTLECPDFKVNTRPDSDYKAVFFDPGVRTFLTGFDTKCRVVEFGVGYDSVLKTCKKMDKKVSLSHKKQPGNLSLKDRLKQKRKQKLTRKKVRYKSFPSAPKKNNHRSNYRLRRRVLPRLRRRLKSQVSDLHWKCAKFICENYTDVHLPMFEVSRMSKKSHVRCLRSKTVRMMCSWSHYRFQNILKYRCSTTGCRFYIANEAHTSRTCCRCGNLKPKSASKMSKCNRCNLKVDRDINGAINICLKQCSQ